MRRWCKLVCGKLVKVHPVQTFRVRELARSRGSTGNFFQRPDAARTRLCACTSHARAFAPFPSPSSRVGARVSYAPTREDRMRIRSNAKRPEVHASQDQRTAFSLVRRPASRPDSSRAQRHQESDVLRSIRYRCELAHRAAAPSARAPQSACSATTLEKKLRLTCVSHR